MKSRECNTKELQQQGIIFLTNKYEKLLQTFWNQITAFDNNQNVKFSFYSCAIAVKGSVSSKQMTDVQQYLSLDII